MSDIVDQHLLSSHLTCCVSAVDQSFQSLVLFFFLNPSQTAALMSVVQQLTSHMTASPDDTDAAAGESVFDMECQNISTHVAGMKQAIEPDVSVSRVDETSTTQSSPVFGRRGIHDVKSTAGLQALHAYDGCDGGDESEDPLASDASHIEEIVVPIGFNSQVIKYVNCMQFLVANSYRLQQVFEITL